MPVNDAFHAAAVLPAAAGSAARGADAESARRFSEALDRSYDDGARHGPHSRETGHQAVRERGRDDDDADGERDGAGDSTLPLGLLHARIDFPAPLAATAPVTAPPELDALLSWLHDRVGEPSALAGVDGQRWSVQLAQGVLPDASLALARRADGWWLVARQCSPDTLRVLRQESAALKTRFRDAQLGDVHLVMVGDDGVMAHVDAEVDPR